MPPRSGRSDLLIILVFTVDANSWLEQLKFPTDGFEWFDLKGTIKNVPNIVVCYPEFTVNTN